MGNEACSSQLYCCCKLPQAGFEFPSFTLAGWVPDQISHHLSHATSGISHKVIKWNVVDVPQTLITGNPFFSGCLPTSAVNVIKKLSSLVTNSGTIFLKIGGRTLLHPILQSIVWTAKPSLKTIITFQSLIGRYVLPVILNAGGSHSYKVLTCGNILYAEQTIPLNISLTET